MKTFIIDWGKSSNGGRYALVQARNINEATLDADVVGSPFEIAELKIKRADIDGCDIRYMELDEVVDSPHRGASIEQSIGGLKASGLVICKALS